MKLVQVYPFKPQALQASVHSLDQVLGASIMQPLGRAASQPSALRGDHKIFRIRIQGFGDEFLGDEWSIGVCGIDKVDSQLDSLAQNGKRSRAVFGRPPDSLACNSHRAVAEPMNGQIAADGERTGLRR